MKQVLAGFLGIMLALAALLAHAEFHTFQIEQIYSNADGTIQFVVLHESVGSSGEQFLAGRALSSTHAGVTKTFVFPKNLPFVSTANRRVLIATQGFASLGLVTPDYVIPNEFLATDGATLNYAGVDQVTFASLPTDGVNAISRAGSMITNAATNFAGTAASVPALAVGLVEYYNQSLDHFFVSDLQPDIDALDSGRIAGWARTGQSFNVFPSQASGGAGVNPVCRFYIPPEHGNSHFFSASPAECSDILQKTTSDPNYSGYIYETPSAFFVALPDTRPAPARRERFRYTDCGISVRTPIIATRPISPSRHR